MGDCVSQTGTRGPQRMSTDAQCLYCKLTWAKERESRVRKKAGRASVADALRGKWSPVLCYYLAIAVFLPAECFSSSGP